MNPIDDAIRAVQASIRGDRNAAHRHLDAAQQHSQAAARRHRQLVEIAGLVVACAYERAEGLALVHVGEFSEDADLLARITRRVVDSREKSGDGDVGLGQDHVLDSV